MKRLDIGPYRGAEQLSLGAESLELGEDFGELSQLLDVRLTHCGLKALPQSLGDLVDCEHLDLWGNDLVELPEGLGRLTQLRYLRVSDNRLEQLVPAIGKLHNLTYLDLSDNRLTALPAEIGQLRHLRTLDLSGNRLKVLPRELGDLKHLRTLRLSRNQLEQLPPSLHNLKSLERLELGDNPLNELFASLERQGMRALLAYLAALGDEAEPCYEAKLLLVGEGQAGKTSLVHCLARGPEAFVAGRSSTHGIEVSELHLPHPKLDETLHFNIWDFGGQREYQISHQFFYSPRALYLVVWNPRRDEGTEEVNEQIERIVLRVGRNVAVLVVGTHASSQGRGIGEADLRAKHGEVLQGFYRIDSQTGEGIEALKLGIARAAAGLEQMGEELPHHWLAARERLIELAKRDPRIDRDQLVALCLEKGMAYGAIPSWTTTHADLGYMIYYPEEERLRRLVVLQPEWLTRAISYVLSDKETVKKGGLLDHGELTRIWHDHGAPDKTVYPREDFAYLLEMMERFELSYRTDSEHSLVAQLVPADRPANVPWLPNDPRGELRQVVLIGALSGKPTGLIHWLIVHCRRESVGVHWESGLYLEKDGQSASITLPLPTSGGYQIYIRARGTDPRGFAEILRDRIDALIDKRWKDLECSWRVPCPQVVDGEACTGIFTLDALQRALEKGKATRECPECVADIPIDQLRNGYQPPHYTLTDVMAELKALGGRQQEQTRVMANYFRTTLKTVLDVGRNAPGMFTLIPRDWEGRETFDFFRTATNQPYRLNLYCEHPERPHQMEQGYDVSLDKEWFIKHGGTVKAVMGLIRIVSSVGSKGWDLLAEDSDARDFLRVTEALGKEIEALDEDNPFENLDEEPRRLSREALQQFRHWLEGEVDPSGAYRGLGPVMVDGVTCWLCPTHRAEYEPPPIQLS